MLKIGKKIGGEKGKGQTMESMGLMLQAVGLIIIHGGKKPPENQKLHIHGGIDTNQDVEFPEKTTFFPPKKKSAQISLSSGLNGVKMCSCDASEELEIKTKSSAHVQVVSHFLQI